jgi:hypothetical protein
MKTLRPKIQHIQILRESEIFSGLIESYRTRVLTQKTRTIPLLGRKSSAKILFTLLGYEVKASYKRIQVPDLVTARYLRLFSEIGCHSIRLPYDPTLTEKLIPEFEATISGIKAIAGERFPQDPQTQQYVIRMIFSIIRRELAAASS